MFTDVFLMKVRQRVITDFNWRNYNYVIFILK